MTIRTRKIAVFLSAASLAGASGLGIAQGASSSSSSSGTTTTAKQRGPGGPGGPGRHHPRLTSAQIAQIAQNLGVSTDALKSALDANRPAKGDGPKGGPAQLAKDLASKLGVEQSAVQEILDANRPARPTSKPAKGSVPPKPDFSKLISALAGGLNIDQASVQAAFDELGAAHQAEETARRSAMFAAIAKSLGTTSDAVQSAFEAVLPAKPAG
jgi:hypothetical protein